ncbi:MMPL family transporter [Candidatus Saccharibacteria bacterium]|nr:MMPL family transporter [Candidatus Saccharibacteria bacterium]
MGKFVVKYHKWILALAVALLIPCLVGFLNTRVNYDMLNYLPDSMETVQGQQELLDSFHKGAFSMIITEDIDDSTESTLIQEISKVDHVDTALGLGNLESANFPSELLPDNIYDTFRQGNESLIAVFFDTSTSADETITAITDIRQILDGHGFVSGASAMVTDLRHLTETEEPIYTAIAVALALLVMLILLDNWLIPFIFLASIGIMILINLGTNFMFGEISYITKALAAVLQLAVTMDYSIFLWHSYREHLAKSKQHSETARHQAMAEAIKATFSSVLGSSATTIAGFIALCFMTFTLGLDLGLVMAKGVLLGVIGSVTVLPALILIFGNKLEKFDHRSIMSSFKWLSSKIVKFFPVFIILFVALIPPFLYGYQKTNENVYYEIASSLPSDMDFAIANQKLSENFGLSNVHMILTDANLAPDQAVALTNDLEQITGVKSVLNFEALTNGEIPFDILPSSVADTLKSDKWELTLVVSEYKNATDEIANQIENINTTIKSYDDSALLVGESSLTQDMITVTSTDFQTVNTISIIAIFIIIALVTGSLSLPFILIAVIESAIFINLGLPFYTNNQLSFIAPICISTIQLGATIDYTILLTTRYKRERLAGNDKRTAARIAIRTSIPSILVSGLGLFAATFGVSLYCNVDMISSLTSLIARGAIISIIAVPTILPSLLILADPLIIRTTLGMKKLVKKGSK